MRRSPVVCIVGPRQCGKTTLARQLLPARREELLRPRGSRGAAAAPGADDGALVTHRSRRHRRGPEAAGPVPGASRPRRPQAVARPLPNPGQRGAWPAPTVRGVSGRAGRVRADGRLRRGRRRRAAGSAGTGCGAASRARSWRAPKPTASRGAASSCRPSWSGTFRSWPRAFRRRRRRCSGSGECSPTTTAGCGRRRTSRRLWAWTRRPCDATWTPSRTC